MRDLTVTKHAHALRFEGVGKPVLVVGCTRYIAALRRMLKGWDFSVTRVAPGDGEGAEFAAEVVRRDGRYYIRSSLRQEVRRFSFVEALNSVAILLVRLYGIGRPDMLTLHTAAFSINGNLLCFAGPVRTGKSTLTARLSMMPGVEIYCDDMFPFDAEGFGLALGIPVRLRLPLPESAGREMVAFVNRHKSFSDRKSLFLNPRSLAAHGHRAPLSHVIFAQRSAGSEGAWFHEVDRNEVVEKVLKRTRFDYADVADYSRVVGRLLETANFTGFAFGDLHDAARTLVRSFPAPGVFRPHREGPAPAGNSGDAASDSRSDSGSSGRERSRVAPADAASSARRWAARPGLIRTAVNDDFFMIETPDKSVCCLNRMGLVIADLLAEGLASDEVIGLLAAQYPSVGAEVIAADVATTIGKLRKAGAIVKAG